jgi:transcriptional regulator with XRE-family HTH domain
MRVFDPGKIRGRRLRQRVTQREFAKKIGITRGYLISIEHGRAMPTAGVIANMADALQVRESFFFVSAVSDRLRKARRRAKYAG